jgi:enamine deaminase RidA (YjgF/YER057c/UK114 family)
MGEREKRLEAKGYALSDAPKPGGLYTPVVVDGKTAYVSGAVPVAGGALKYKGKVPSQVSADDAQKAAELCAANLLRVLSRDLGSLDRIDRVLKVTGFVNSEPDFTEQHVVVNGASQLFLDVLGESGHHARSAVGMAGLPLGAAVEVELIVKLV